MIGVHLVLRLSPLGVLRCRFVGVMHMEYIQYLSREGVPIQPSITTGNGMDFLIGRISYSFSLVGPCVSTHTACSSSLVAMHLGRRALQDRDCQSSVVAGVFTITFSDTMNAIGQLNALSPDGRCKAFSSVANGYGRGEGVTTMALGRDKKPSNSSIGIIRGTSFNHSGRSSGLTAPNGLSQAALIRQTLREASLQGGDISSISSHGTGTSLGDPIEVGAIMKGYGVEHAPPKYILSSKSMVGHTEGSAGLAGGILALSHLKGMSVAPITHLIGLNPHISKLLTNEGGNDSAGSQSFPRELSGSIATETGFASTSSFGMSGVNAHAVFSCQAGRGGPFNSRRLPFVRDQYWLPAIHRTLTRKVLSISTDVVLFQISLSKVPDLYQHTVRGQPIFPGTGFLDICSSCIDLGIEDNKQRKSAISAVITSPLLLSSVADLDIQCSFSLVQGRLNILSGTGQRCSSDTSEVLPLRMSRYPTKRRHMNFCSLIFAPCIYDMRKEEIATANIARISSANSARQSHSIDPFYADSSMHTASALSIFRFGETNLAVPTSFMGVHARRRPSNCREIHALAAASSMKLKAELISQLTMNEVTLKPFYRRYDPSVGLQEHNFNYCVKEEVSAPVGGDRTGAVSLASDATHSIPEYLGAKLQQIKSILQLGKGFYFSEVKHSMAMEYPYRANEINLKSGALHGMVKAVATEREVDVCMTFTSDTSTHKVHSEDSKRFGQFGRHISASVIIDSRLEKSLDDSIPSSFTLQRSSTDMHFYPSSDKSDTDLTLRVHAVGLNFRDVLNAMGLYPGNPQPIASDCSGVIMSGSKSGLKQGDRVFGFVPGCLGGHVGISHPEMLLKVPGSLSLDEACTLPTVYCTALMCIQGVKSGDRILVHAGSGALGMALLEVAQSANCTSFVTASSCHKRHVVRKNYRCRSLGDSRKTTFVDDISLSVSEVDRVINSLTSPGMVAASAAVMAFSGSFLEVGKRNIWSCHRMSQERPDVLMHTVALDYASPGTIHNLLKEVGTLFAKQRVRLPHYTQYYISSVQTAMKAYSNTNHVGKLMIKNAKPLGEESANPWLITGGAGDLGVVATDFLISYGMKTIKLINRKPKRLGHLSETSSEVTHLGCDLSFREDWDLIIENSYGRTITGVVHSAGITKDSAIESQNMSSIRQVLAPKLSLRGATGILPLQKCILFSSIASLIGSAGQLNYCAANGALDAFSSECRSTGILALSIQWGAWSQGMASTQAVRKAASRSGVVFLEPWEAVDCLKSVLLNANFLSISSVPIFKMEWKRTFTLVGSVPYFLAEIHEETAGVLAANNNAIRSRSDIPRYEDIDSIQMSIQKIAEGITGAPIGLDDPFMDVGVDSLGLVEMQNSLNKVYPYNIDATEILNYPTVRALSGHVLLNFEGNKTGNEQNKIRTSMQNGLNDTSKPVFIRYIAQKATIDKSVTENTDKVIGTPICRWNTNDDSVVNHKLIVRFGVFLRDLFAFDHLLFKLSLTEALSIDPQQRLLLENSLEISQSVAVSKSCSVMVGIGAPDYQYHVTWIDANVYSASGCANSVASGRISYLFDLNGPCASIDTACSSSMVALHYAYNEMKWSRYQEGIASGVNAILTPTKTMLFSLSGMLSLDGRCKTLDAEANGYVRSESCTSMLLTYMQEENLGAVFGTSVGQDGKSGSLTAPNGPAQQRVILSALENSKISAVEFHIEMHGTGTELGDPIEYGSILQTSPSKYITFSASKTDYGHCETAAGLLSVVNVVQQPRRNSVQQIRHLRFINSYIDRMLENQGSNVFQARQDAPIARHCDQRLLGASSFAFQVRHKILPCLSKMLYETITKTN